MIGRVLAVARDGTHRFSKTIVPEIELVAGEGVVGDAHRGITVKHRSRVRKDPTQPNLRQVHLIQSELFSDLSQAGFTVAPADLGENIATTGLDLLALPRDTVLRVGGATLRITGLRNPCAQIEAFLPGLLAQLLIKGPHGTLLRKAGIMAIVERGGTLRPGDTIQVDLPGEPHLPLDPV